jgi:serine/threonine-protein kinase
MKVPLRGGTPIIICEIMPPNRGASWGVDDSIAFTRSYTSGLYLVSAAGGTPQAITTIDFEKKEKTHRFPQILPDGKTVLFTIGTSEFTSYDDSLIAIVSLETGKRKILIEGGSNAKYAQSGHIVYAGAGSLMAVPFNLKRLEVTGSPVRILDGVVTSDAIGVAQFSFSSSGSLIYATGGPEVYYKKLMWVDRKGEIRLLPVTPRGFVTAECSPDGKRLALQVRGGNEDVWIYEIEREILTRLTSAGGDNGFPIWTPDSNRVTYLNSIGGVYALVWKPADGSGFAEKLITSEHRLNPTSWSPDGKMLAFTESHLSTGADIWILTIEGERKPQLFLKTSSDETGAKFSHNGRWMAYSSNESGKFEVYVRPFPGPGRKWQISTEGGKSPVWAPDSRELFYRTEDKMMVVAIKTKPEFSAGKPKLLFKAPSNLFNMGIAPDGQRFVMIEEAEYSTLPTQLNIVLNWFEELKRLVPTGK